NGPTAPALPGFPVQEQLPALSLPPGGGQPGPDATVPCEATPEQRRFDLIASWADGLRFRSADDAFHLHVGGNAQVDSTWLIGPQGAFALPNNGGTSGIGNAAGTFLRRVRLRLEGAIYDQFDYIVEYDFAHANNENSGIEPPSFGNLSSSPVPCNVWMQVRDVPFFGNIRIGNQVKPIG